MYGNWRSSADRDVGRGAPVRRGSLFACYPRKGLRSGMNWGGSGGVRMLRVRVLVWIHERGKWSGIGDVSFAFRILKHVKGCGRTNLGVLILNFEDQVPGQERRQVGSSYG